MLGWEGGSEGHEWHWRGWDSRLPVPVLRDSLEQVVIRVVGDRAAQGHESGLTQGVPIRTSVNWGEVAGIPPVTNQ